MTSAQVIAGWKNPDIRAILGMSGEHPAGLSFQELSTNEMEDVHGKIDPKLESFSLSCFISERHPSWCP
ncbi:TPA: mersacidin/lichenicidin family type 2 lantibiotic [Bacillus thuringiensis]|uniref:mersacidin/lichenicidin family type 2 lantibiotic n=1 Tax=Bacillus sp. CH_70 TaxID=2978215 RepID=UPI0030FAA925|nr:mersacidin/lichenicidin family type 2 lantibiotic [Bacillus thuringiensis]